MTKEVPVSMTLRSFYSLLNIVGNNLLSLQKNQTMHQPFQIQKISTARFNNSDRGRIFLGRPV